MKKILVILIIFINSCTPPYDENSNILESKNRIFYFKDNATNLCFAAIENQSSYNYNLLSITCVPCDSLKKIKIR